MPLYTTPILGVSRDIFCTVVSSTRMDGTCSRGHTSMILQTKQAADTMCRMLDQTADCFMSRSCPNGCQQPSVTEVAVKLADLPLCGDDDAIGGLDPQRCRSGFHRIQRILDLHELAAGTECREREGVLQGMSCVSCASFQAKSRQA